MPDSVIEVRNLTKRFGTVTAVDGISFSVARGSTVALLGGNGATMFRGPLIEGATVEIAADDAQDLGGSIGMQCAVPGNPA